MHQVNRWGGFCSCYKAKACCGRCTPPSWGKTQITSYIRPTAAATQPDPTCTHDGALLSADKTACCPSYCKDVSGNNVCGPRWDCHNNVVGGGVCCSGNFAETCDVHAAPCLM
jgi:hypothetical protein